MIGIIFIGDIKYCPYLNKYTNLLDDGQIKYEVLFWHRENSQIDCPPNYKFYCKYSKLSKSPIRKLWDFIGFRNWLNNELVAGKYDKLIILSTLSGVFIFDKLIKEYKKIYIFDIRDYSYEHIRLFAFIEKLVIKNSYLTAISSSGFREFLPLNFNYQIVHNFCKNDVLDGFVKNKSLNGNIRVVFNGVIRYFDYQCKIIDKLGNDNRFELIYHGNGPDFYRFQKYVEKKKITNVFFTGGYNNSLKKKLLEETDIINNSYGYLGEDISNKVKYAISNKYYDGIMFRIPQLVEVGTYKCKLVEENALGIGLDVNDRDFADKLYNYYVNINTDVFNSNCSILISEYLKEDDLFRSAVLNFFAR